MSNIAEGSPLYADWFYVDGDKRVGPVSFAELERRFSSRTLHEKTLVWTAKFDDDWKELGAVIIAKVPEVCVPAAPKKMPDNFWFYILICSPVPLALVEAGLWYLFPEWLTGGMGVILLYLTTSVTLVLLDIRALDKSGRKDVTGSLIVWLFFLVPLYVLFRASKTHGKGLLLTVIYLLFSIAGSYLVEELIAKMLVH
ncbi:protein of unknown function [Pseudovibrio ascidiaceicola]|uniref:GYF domain-containing protein n=1 Tax=Pseudovibrio ascidiaceicola TaxID=285279 RepID=A0A1I4E488_9HYPH|nr:DUF4339 domain-containing protein [Pseudovibrio ascidiaceicola]SFK99780.1 protein of unknown function [Pseudovibrio ascidiaceicola]